MTDRDETTDGPENDRAETGEKPPVLMARLKQLYADRPGVFTVLTMGVSALVFLLGAIVSSEVDLLSVFQMN
ncbi:hypothetical protein [Streptomyces sp. NPDC007083]|uniref:hypothetical protein n=1 Tax=Streptomyces sp. NPDC007083 TaxID=3156913 RepID=UPI0033FA7C4D